MAKSQINFINPEEDDYELDDSTDEEFDSDDSEVDPSFTDELLIAQTNLSKLSINSQSNSRNGEESQEDDEGLISQKLSKEDALIFENVQKIIDCGKVEKLKVDQCKVYLRKHGLRLTGKKDILIQRIKEHIEILNGGGEAKYPPSSFVLNCKGDACLGDVVMFEQTVYEGYSIVSRSAAGPPCGKRTVAGRIVNESYGAAKQQHTFTVEVLWSKGQNPLPPLHPLLIKGRNLYKLDTRRQKWENEAERQRVLSEKHTRGTVARSNREVRIQEKMARKSVKGVRRVVSKNKANPCHQNDLKHATDQQQVPSKGVRRVASKNKANPCHQNDSKHATDQQQVLSKVPTDRRVIPSSFLSRYPLTQPDKPDLAAPHFPIERRVIPSSFLSRYPLTQIDEPALPAPHFLQQPRFDYRPPQNTYSTHGYQRQPVNSALSCSFTERNPPRTAMTGPQQLFVQRQKLCRYYPQGRCHYGNQCKFLHESNVNR